MEHFQLETNDILAIHVIRDAVLSTQGRIVDSHDSTIGPTTHPWPHGLGLNGDITGKAAYRVRLGRLPSLC